MRIRRLVFLLTLFFLPVTGFPPAQAQDDYDLFRQSAAGASLLYRGRQAYEYALLYNGTYYWESSIFSPGEVGDPLYYSAAQIIKDMDWTNAHPIKWIYEFLTEDKFQKMWDPLAVINAVEGDDIIYKLSPRGRVKLTPTGETIFTEDPNGNARYQYPGPEGWSDYVLQYIRLLSIQH